MSDDKALSFDNRAAAYRVPPSAVKPRGAVDTALPRSVLSDDKVLALDNTTEAGDHRMATKPDLLQGTLDLLILKALTLGALHGWGISKRIRDMSRDVLEVNQGSLYPALHRLEDRGYVTAEWKTSDEGRRAKFYRLTKQGRAQFVDEEERWKVFAAAVGRTLQAS